MANLREYFVKELEGLSLDTDLTLKTPTGEEVVVVEKINFDTLAGVNFVSYFFPMGAFTRSSARHLLDNLSVALDRAKNSVSITVSHPTADPEGVIVVEQPFSGRVYMYVDDYIDDSVRSELTEYGLGRDARLKLRDKRHSDYCTSHEIPWAFICHDSRDKDEVARPLALKLSSMLCPVWYDEYAIGVGDSLRESIDNGIRAAKKCIIVLSRDFFSNPGWTKAEFNAAMGKHIASGGSTILPIWHDVSKEEVSEYSTILADLAGLRSTLGIDEMARQLFRKFEPRSS